MTKEKINSKNRPSSKTFWIRVCLSFLIIVATSLIFYFGGGLNLFKKYTPTEEMASADFEINFIDVGQGDSTLIRLPDNKTVLIDTGENSASESLISYVSEVFDYHKIEVIDYLIFTHQDSDHIGSGQEVLQKFQVNCVYRPMQLSQYELDEFGESAFPSNYPVSTTKTYSAVIEAVYNEPNCEMKFSKAGEVIEGENYKFEFLTPITVDSNTDNNNFSPLIMFEYNGAKVLFTGDAETNVEKEAVSIYVSELKADVLKVGHHGSNTSSSQAFLDVVQPSYSIISVAKENQYNLPSDKVVERLKNSGSQVLSTAENGTIVLTIESNGNIKFLSHNVPDSKIIVVVCVGVLLLMLVWGIKVKKKSSKKR